MKVTREKVDMGMRRERDRKRSVGLMESGSTYCYSTRHLYLNMPLVYYIHHHLGPDLLVFFHRIGTAGLLLRDTAHLQSKCSRAFKKKGRSGVGAAVLETSCTLKHDTLVEFERAWIASTPDDRLLAASV